MLVARVSVETAVNDVRHDLALARCEHPEALTQPPLRGQGLGAHSTARDSFTAAFASIPASVPCCDSSAP